MDEWLSQVLTAVLSSGGWTLILALILKNWIKNAMTAAQEERKRNAKFMRDDYKLVDRYRRHLGWCLYWLIKAVFGMFKFIKMAQEKDHEKQYEDVAYLDCTWEEELHNSFTEFQQVEKEMKELKAEQLSYLHDDD